MKRDKFIAVIGCGYWGINLVRNFYDLGVLNTVCDTETGILNSLRDRFINVDITSHFERILESSDIRAVVIATPAITHYDLATKAILADKDVFVEKPLAMTTEDAKKLLKLSEAKKRILMVGHILQYHPAVIKLKELIKNGDLGKIQYIYSNRLNIGKLRTEENILWSFAPHDISVMLMLMDEEPMKVSAFGADCLKRKIFDATLTTLVFKNNVKGHIFVSWLHPYKEQKLIIVGTKAMAVFDDVSKEKLYIFPHKIEWKDGNIPIARKAECHVIPVEQKEPLREELLHFIECIDKRKKPKTDGYEGLKVLKILELAEASLREYRYDKEK